mgnify:CR=1 FL=1
MRNEVWAVEWNGPNGWVLSAAFTDRFSATFVLESWKKTNPGRKYRIRMYVPSPGGASHEV